MKKNSRIGKSNEWSKPMNTLNAELKPIHSRSDPSIKPSLHPWYYVKGRRDLTEKNISSRREREDQRHRQSVSNNQFFSKRLAESQVYHKWNDNKSLVRHPKQETGLSQPPFDVLIEPKTDWRQKIRSNKELEKKYLKSKTKLTEIMAKFEDLDQKYTELEKRQNSVVFHLKEVKKIRTSFEEKIEFCALNEKLFYHLRCSRDKSRKKTFLIMDQLEWYKSLVQKTQHLNRLKPVVTEEELIQLSEVMNRAIKILDMYLELNHNRNNELQTMFDEEADLRWQTQEEEWQQESQVWNVMIEKLINSYKNILKDKLSQLLAEQKTSLEQREQLLKELTTYTAHIKADPHLSEMLTQDITHFMTNVVKS